MQQETIRIDYDFRFGGQRPDMEFSVRLDRATATALPPLESASAVWTRLEYHQCEICPFTAGERLDCPIAFNISGLADAFSEVFSIEEAEIVVSTEERTCLKRERVAQGLSSILGIYLAASGCPHMDILKPMARFHLPFASLEETLFRHLGNYLIRQYFESLALGGGDLSLRQLAEHYARTDRVNHGICRRIASVTAGDANRNALATLNAIGLMLRFQEEGRFDAIKYLYRPAAPLQ
jgi:hypothetical protein